MYMYACVDVDSFVLTNIQIYMYIAKYCANERVVGWGNESTDKVLLMYT